MLTAETNTRIQKQVILLSSSIVNIFILHLRVTTRHPLTERLYVEYYAPEKVLKKESYYVQPRSTTMETNTSILGLQKVLIFGISLSDSMSFR